MEKGYSFVSKSYLKYMDQESKDQMDLYYLECLGRSYTRFSNYDDGIRYLANFSSVSLDPDEALLVKDYTGYNYKFINNALRGTWNYEDNGNIKDMPIYRKRGEDVSSIIEKHGISLGNILVYRGVSIDYFKDYGISSLADLSSLKGKYLVDIGLVSTSMLEDTCYYQKDLETSLNYDVKIEYMIPSEFSDGMYIGNTSYSPNQNEYLINTGNMAKVIDVIYDGDGVIIKAMMIPKVIYDKGYRQLKENSLGK